MVFAFILPLRVAVELSRRVGRAGYLSNGGSPRGMSDTREMGVAGESVFTATIAWKNFLKLHVILKEGMSFAVLTERGAS